MKQQTFAEALDIAKKILYDLTAKKILFTFYCRPDKKQLKFTAVKDCDIVKAMHSQFEIQFDSRGGRYAELIIEYV